MERDKNGYLRGKIEHSDLIHRQIAYSEIYLKKRHKYLKKFSEYVVHHIDTDKDNFSVDNLYICIGEEHNAIHKEQKKRLKKFTNSKELDKFLANLKKKEHKEKTNKRKKNNCEDCGREILHKGCCILCNIERKKFREQRFAELRKKRRLQQKRKKSHSILIGGIIGFFFGLIIYPSFIFGFIILGIVLGSLLKVLEEIN